MMPANDDTYTLATDPVARWALYAFGAWVGLVACVGLSLIP